MKWRSDPVDIAFNYLRLRSCVSKAFGFALMQAAGSVRRARYLVVRMEQSGNLK